MPPANDCAGGDRVRRRELSAFRNTGAIAVGILARGLELAHIALGLFLPAAAVAPMVIAGTLYPVWFFLAGRKLLRLAATDR
jgi:hypothetical protein